MGSLTQDIGTFIAELRHEDLPAAATPVIRNGFTDYVATVVLGRNDDVTNCVRQTLVGKNEDPEARILLSATRRSGPRPSVRASIVWCRSVASTIPPPIVPNT